jgi:hypothetical protein
MSEKQVIMSKKEFDQMEADLNDFASIVDSKTVCRIAYPKLTWDNIYGRAREVSSYEVDYVVGSDENEIIKELSAEITYLNSIKDNLNDILTLHEASIFRLQRQENDWKQLPWYKRLFV